MVLLEGEVHHLLRGGKPPIHRARLQRKGEKIINAVGEGGLTVIHMFKSPEGGGAASASS